MGHCFYSVCWGLVSDEEGVEADIHFGFDGVGVVFCFVSVYDMSMLVGEMTESTHGWTPGEYDEYL
jgi:hypothetical protein